MLESFLYLCVLGSGRSHHDERMPGTHLDISLLRQGLTVSP